VRAYATWVRRARNQLRHSTIGHQNDTKDSAGHRNSSRAASIAAAGWPLTRTLIWSVVASQQSVMAATPYIDLVQASRRVAENVTPFTTEMLVVQHDPFVVGIGSELMQRLRSAAAAHNSAADLSGKALNVLRIVTVLRTH
jgi:hypothetical protein